MNKKTPLSLVYEVIKQYTTILHERGVFYMIKIHLKNDRYCKQKEFESEKEGIFTQLAKGVLYS